jgi:hypothetical protein
MLIKLVGNNMRSLLIRLTHTKSTSPPKPPNSWECCGDNCPNCVWTTYFEELKKYKQIQELEKQNKFWKSTIKYCN